MLILFIFSNIQLSLYAFAQRDKQFYLCAYREQSQFFNRQHNINFKLIVFLTDRTLNYVAFCTQNSNIGVPLKEINKLRGIEKYRTEGNWATFHYMPKYFAYTIKFVLIKSQINLYYENRKKKISCINYYDHFV